MSQTSHEEKGPAEAGKGVVEEPLGYRGVNPEFRETLRQHAVRIRAAYADASKRVLEMGKELMLAKGLFAHGKFGPWLKDEFGWSERTAERYMRAYEVFEAKADTVSVLEPTAIYDLSAKSTPEAVRDEVVARLEAGERPSLQEIKTTVAAARKEVVAAKAAKRAVMNEMMGRPVASRRGLLAQRAANFILERLGADREALAQLMKDVDAKLLVEALSRGDVVDTTAQICTVEL